MFFSQIKELAKTTSIHLIITASGEDELKVAVLPQSREGVNPALTQPLILTATPEELDEKFLSVLTTYKAKRKSLEESLEEATLVMEAAGKAAQESATKATQKAAKKPASAAVTTVEEDAGQEEESPSAPATPASDDELSLF